MTTAQLHSRSDETLECTSNPVRFGDGSVRPLRIVVFEPEPNFGGGCEQLALDLSRSLAERGHRISLVHDCSGTMLPNYAAFAENCRRIDVGAFGWRTLPSSISRARRIAALVKSLKADILFSSNVDFVRLLALASTLSRVPLVFHLGISSPLSYFSQRMAFRTVAAGVAPSQHTADTWRRDGWPQKRLHVISNSVDCDRFCPPLEDKSSIRRALGLPIDRFLFVCVGRLKEDKGTDVALRAFASMTEGDANVALVFVGGEQDGSTARWAARARQLRIPTDQILFVGRQNEVADYYRASDAAIVPSLVLEAFGLTVLEAMASGVPPIVSDVGIMPQLVGATVPSLVVAPGDPELLANRMKSVRALETRLPALGRTLRERALMHFSCEQTVARYEQVFACVCPPPCRSAGAASETT